MEGPSEKFYLVDQAASRNLKLMTYSPLLQNTVYRASNSVVLFCNHTAYDFSKKKYLFDMLISESKLQRILVPEHGLFASAADQVSVEHGFYQNIPIYSLYNKSENILKPDSSCLYGADLLLIDVPDVGVRYFTYVTHVFALLKLADKIEPSLPILLIDRSNPIGKKIEGTIMDDKYASFLGPASMIHRHGMTWSEISSWYIGKQQLKLSIQYLDIKRSTYIAPSPNLPSLQSLHVYPGQCFWEATSWSEGRGTSNPFELVGHPALSNENANAMAAAFNKRFAPSARLQPTTFIPSANKHANKVCTGWKLAIANTEAYHSIFGTLYLMRLARDLISDYPFWRDGPYEVDSIRTAAQTLIGDDDLIDYVDGKINEITVQEKLAHHASIWVNDIKPYRRSN